METAAVRDRALRIDGVEWSYGVAGQGPAGLLALPGIIGGGEAFGPLATEGDGEWTTLLIRYPRAAALSAVVTGLAGILDHEGLEETHVYGGSFGGLIAQAFLNRFPGRTRNVVLSGTGPPDRTRLDRNESAIWWVRRLPMPLLRALLRALVRSTPARRRHGSRTLAELLPQRDLPPRARRSGRPLSVDAGLRSERPRCSPNRILARTHVDSRGRPGQHRQSPRP